MLDAVVANEKEPDVVQLSGGEPTIHPKFFEILDYANIAYQASHAQYQWYKDSP